MYQISRRKYFMDVPTGRSVVPMSSPSSTFKMFSGLSRPNTRSCGTLLLADGKRRLIHHAQVALQRLGIGSLRSSTALRLCADHRCHTPSMFLASSSASACTSTARSATAESVVKQGLPKPPPKSTTAPFFRRTPLQRGRFRTRAACQRRHHNGMAARAAHGVPACTGSS